MEIEGKQRQENDRKLIEQVLEIYYQKYVAELLRKVGKTNGAGRHLTAGSMMNAPLGH